jgi:drug/metabolite transporter (DMT)-like permease
MSVKVGSGIAQSVMGSVERMRRASPVDAMLLGTVLLWALNAVVTRFMLQHGWKPLAYGVIRYFFAISLFLAFTWWRERSFRIDRGDWWLVAAAGLFIFLNQLCFVYALKLATASMFSLLLGATPIFIGVIATVIGLERLRPTFWIGALATFAGVGLIAVSAGGDVSGSLLGALLSIGTAFTWSCYSLTIGPLMQRYSPVRISSVVLAIGWLPLAAVGAHQIPQQDVEWSPLLWAAFAFAVVGPLFLTNILWFSAIDVVGAARASLFANLQPVFAVTFAVFLLSESLDRMELGGGLLIFAGIAFERIWHRPQVVVAPE